MSDANHDRDDPQPKRMLYQMQERLETVRRRVRRQQAHDSGVGEGAHLQLAETIVEYHDMLLKYRNEEAVADDFPEIADIRNRMGKTAQIRVPAPGDTTNQQIDEVPALLELSTGRLLEAARELEDVSLTLGFAATASPDTTHRTEIDDDLIEEVEQWRQENLDE